MAWVKTLHTKGIAIIINGPVADTNDGSTTTIHRKKGIPEEKTISPIHITGGENALVCKKKGVSPFGF